MPNYSKMVREHNQALMDNTDFTEPVVCWYVDIDKVCMPFTPELDCKKCPLQDYHMKQEQRRLLMKYNKEFISDTEIERVKHLINILHCNDNPVIKAYIAGGSLCRADSKDIDVLVHTEVFNEDAYFEVDWDDDGSMSLDGDIIIDQIEDLDWVREVEFFFQYSEEDLGKDIIIKVHVEDGRAIDLLIGSTDFHGKPIQKYMEKYFPLSVQCVALDVDNTQIYTSTAWEIGAESNTVFYVPQGGNDKDYINKYKGYYPEARFICSS